jgi:predicted nuclease with TOPRIM domain
MSIISELNNKIDKLIKLYITSLEQNKSLQNQIKQLQTELEQVKGENTILNEKIKTNQVANAILGKDDSYEAKMRINRLVREIDKCITLLNN